MPINPSVAPFNDLAYVLARYDLATQLLSGDAVAIQKLPGAAGLTLEELYGDMRVAATQNWNLYADLQAKITAVAKGTMRLSLDDKGNPVFTTK